MSLQDKEQQFHDEENRLCKEKRQGGMKMLTSTNERKQNPALFT